MIAPAVRRAFAGGGGRAPTAASGGGAARLFAARARTPDMASNVDITEEAGVVVAYDPDTDVASQGETRPAALSNLGAAVEIHTTRAGDVASSATESPVPVPTVEWF